MNWLQRYRDRNPEGIASLLFMQMFSTMGFAVLYSTLVLYLVQHLNFAAADADSVVGVFMAFNYGLHLLGGYMGGRLMSYRGLFVSGMAMQFVGCGLIAAGTVGHMYIGLALFLVGAGVNVTCINMMVTQRFEPTDLRREGAFLWNYAGMNVGFFAGFTVAGHYQLKQDFGTLFTLATVGNLGALLIAGFNWRAIADRNTSLQTVSVQSLRRRYGAGLAVLAAGVPVVWLLQHPGETALIIKSIFVALIVVFVVTAWRHPVLLERRNMWAYFILAVGSFVFWTPYQMAPMGLALFTQYNVTREVWGIEIAPQWVQNINTVVIVVGGPLLAAAFASLRRRGWRIDVPLQFALALVLMAVGFLVLPLGILFADDHGKVAFLWLFANYVMQSLGELLISPVGYAMIGHLAPARYQGPMMGGWMLLTGVASLISGELSASVPDAAKLGPIESNPGYSAIFLQLGIASAIVAIALLALIPTLRRLISESDSRHDDAMAESAA